MMLGTALFLFAVGAATCQDYLNETIVISPAYLDGLLKAKQYEEFAEAMGVENVDLVRPGSESSKENPMFNKGLEEGDIFLTLKQAEEARQGIRFDRYGGSRWNGEVIYYIADDFSDHSKWMIRRAIALWNTKVDCVKWVEWKDGDEDCVIFFKGSGCWSYVGRIGGYQLLSLQEYGCIHRGIILHEMNHAVGVTHEQSRLDRDNFISINWDDIPDEWKGQYQMTNSYSYGLQGPYDLYSVMHYGMFAPGTDKKAFEILVPGIDEDFVGRGDDLTCTDVDKLRILYCRACKI